MNHLFLPPLAALILVAASEPSQALPNSSQVRPRLQLSQGPGRCFEVQLEPDPRRGGLRVPRQLICPLAGKKRI